MAATNGMTAREWDRNFRVCPFNPSHVVSRLRFINHLLKCKTKYAHLGFVMCRYDASHYIKPEEMAAHLLVCDKREICQDRFEITQRPLSRPCNSAYITDDSENWDDDDDCMDEERTTISKKNAGSVKASTETMALYHENAYGFVTTIGRGTFRSHLGALPSASSCLALSTSKTQRNVVEEKKCEEVIEEKEEEEEEIYDDFDDNYSKKSLDLQSFKKFYKDIHLPSRKSPEPESHSAEENTRANIETANKSVGRGNMRHLLDSSSTTKEPPASRGIGRGRGCLTLLPEFLESAEKKPIASVDMKKEMATVEDKLEAVKFQPSKARLQGLLGKEHGEDDWQSD